MTKAKRIFAVIITIVMVCVMSFSAIFVIKEADHNCCGSDCQMCQQISNCLNLFKKLSLDSNTLIMAVAVIFTVILAVGIVERFFSKNNLVGLKVKLSS